MTTDKGARQEYGAGQRAAHDESAPVEIKQTQNREATFDCWRWCSGRAGGDRHSGLRFGIFLIVVGLLWLGRTVGWFRSDSFWPLVIILIGGWVAVLNLFRIKRKS